MMFNLLRPLFAPRRRQAHAPVLQLECLEERSAPAHFALVSSPVVATNAAYGHAALSKVWGPVQRPATGSVTVQAPDRTNGTAYAGWDYNGSDLSEDVHLGMASQSSLAAQAGVEAKSSAPNSTSFNYQLLPDRGDRVGDAVSVTLRPTITGNNTTAHGSVHVVFIVSYNGREVYHYDHTASGAAAHLPAATYTTFRATVGATFQVTMSVTATASGGAGEDIRGHANLNMIYARV
jgi:hypothetical protein